MKNQRTRERVSIKEKRKGEIFGFQSKTPLNAEGFMEGRYLILTKDGKQYEEFGYSRAGIIIKGNEDTIDEDARLNAISKVMYRKGYFVGRENYENLDQEKIESVEMIDYLYYYTEGENANKFSRYNRDGREFVAERDKRGRFKTSARKVDPQERIRLFNEIN